MKISRVIWLLVFCMLFYVSPVLAQQSVTLAWDPSQGPDVAGYRVYQSELQGNTATQWQQIGETSAAETTFTFTVSSGSKSYAWIVTAYASDGQESFPSNPAAQVKKPPGPPGNNRR